MTTSHQQQRMPLGHFFAQQLVAERLINDQSSLVNRAYAAIGSVELTTGKHIERTLQAISALKEAINAACTLPEQRTVPYSVSLGDWAYRSAWNESLALMDDAVLFLSAYKDVLEEPELQVVGECLERQVNLRTHHVHLILAVRASIRNVVEWRKQMREDEEEEVQA